MKEIEEKIKCYHCGDDCTEDFISSEGKIFCCEGCHLVYDILKENNLCSYYSLNESPGIKNNIVSGTRYNYLDEPSIQSGIISFKNNSQVHVTFHIPAMHCSSCIWLLENMSHLDKGVLNSKVNFLKKEVTVIYDDTKTSLRKIVEELSGIGYEPALHLDSLEKKVKKKVNRGRIIRIGIAGFCFGNIMMLSFPEYFSPGKTLDADLKYFFSYLILFLSLPVFFYCASEFFIQSWRAIKQKTTSIDIPIAIGIAAIYLRSTYEIVTHSGTGYFDSGSGLVFFMLIGRWFQDFTFDGLSFDRDYKSYFPIAVTRIKNGIEKEIAVNELKIKDRILIRNSEIIPVDAILLKGNASIDYSFVTGESVPVHLSPGELIYAGGKQTGSLIELQVSREILQSHITQLWNNEITRDHVSRFENLTKSISKWFIIVTLFIAFTAAAFWWTTDITRSINAFTAVLVIACPCALALSAPFTYGNILRILGKNKIYLRNYHVLENLADINTIVFDKTGTLTDNSGSEISFVGEPLLEYEDEIIHALTRQSSHPLSRQISKELSANNLLPVKEFREISGRGISAYIGDHLVKAGNEKYINGFVSETDNSNTKVFISIDNEFRGYFILKNKYRTGIHELAGKLLKKKFRLFVLSGDNASEKNELQKLLSENTPLCFNQSPEDKLDFIKTLQHHKCKVLMIGDGMNDAGALRQSNTGISLAENINNFTPASDVIMDASRLSQLGNLIAYSKASSVIIIWSFIISLLYNFLGLSYAVTGTLSPLTAAILMPISTISLVLFTVLLSSLKGRRLKFS